jgi:hypothetical protein
MIKTMNEIKKIRHPEKIHKPDNISPPKPNWLRVRAPLGKIFDETKGLLDDLNITTVCEEASCPNIGNCWSKKHATMMIMGDTCTTACFFDQQLPMLGQLASSHTVVILRSSNSPLVSSKIFPKGALTLSQFGFGAETLSGLCIFSGCLIFFISFMDFIIKYFINLF